MDCDCLLFSETVHKHAYSKMHPVQYLDDQPRLKPHPCGSRYLAANKLSDLQPYTRRLLLVTDSILLLSPSITTHRDLFHHVLA